MLVVKQCAFAWRCNSYDLEPFYAKAVHILQRLEQRGFEVELMHIHREFNALADTLANLILDSPAQRDSHNWHGR